MLAHDGAVDDRHGLPMRVSMSHPRRTGWSAMRNQRALIHLPGFWCADLASGARMRISAIVDARFSVIVDGVSS